MAGTVKLPHLCPHCSKTVAKTHKELDKLFGYRNLGTGATNQSWCKKCR